MTVKFYDTNASQLARRLYSRFPKSIIKMNLCKSHPQHGNGVQLWVRKGWRTPQQQQLINRFVKYAGEVSDVKVERNHHWGIRLINTRTAPHPTNPNYVDIIPKATKFVFRGKALAVSRKGNLYVRGQWYLEIVGHVCGAKTKTGHCMRWSNNGYCKQHS